METNGWKHPRPCLCRRNEMADIDQAEKRRLKREKAERIQSLFHNSMMGEFFQDKTLEGYDRKRNLRAIKLAERYLETFQQRMKDGKGIVMLGPVGTGKTHLAAAVCSVLMREHLRSVVFATWSQILRRLRQTYDSKGEASEEQVIKALIGCDLLCIDDLGRERPSEWSREKIFDVVDARYCLKKPLMITTNYALQDLSLRIGDAAASRIAERCHVSTFRAGDYRIQVAAKALTA